MAFIASPAFSNLYGSQLLSIAPLPQNPLLSSSQVAAISSHQSQLQQPFMLQQQQGAAQQHIGGAHAEGADPSVLDPFDPKASVPLPHQLDDQPFTTSVWKRNERERYRVRCVNDGYERLRQFLPLADGEKRISKVDTLRLAVRYIRHLDNLIHTRDHLLRCRCFDRFREESEGNVTVVLRPTGERYKY